MFRRLTGAGSVVLGAAVVCTHCNGYGQLIEWNSDTNNGNGGQEQHSQPNAFVSEPAMLSGTTGTVDSHFQPYIHEIAMAEKNLNDYDELCLPRSTGIQQNLWQNDLIFANDLGSNVVKSVFEIQKVNAKMDYLLAKHDVTDWEQKWQKLEAKLAEIENGMKNVFGFAEFEQKLKNDTDEDMQKLKNKLEEMQKNVVEFQKQMDEKLDSNFKSIKSDLSGLCDSIVVLMFLGGAVIGGILLFGGLGAR